MPERTRKSCEQLFLNKHGYALPPGRKLVGTQAAPILSGSHTMPPDPKDFSLLPVRRMKLEDGSVGAVSNVSELSIHTIYLKIRAFLYSAVFVNMDQPEWFDLAAAEALIDRLMNFLHHHHSAGRPPISFYTNAWESTARAFQLGIRSGKTLKELAAQEKHLRRHLLDPVRPRNPTDGLSRERLQGPWTLDSRANPAPECPVGRARSGPCFKPSGAYPCRRVVRRLTPQRGLLPSPHAGGRLPTTEACEGAAP